MLKTRNKYGTHLYDHLRSTQMDFGKESHKKKQVRRGTNNKTTASSQEVVMTSFTSTEASSARWVRAADHPCAWCAF